MSGRNKPPIHRLKEFIEADRAGFIQRLALGMAMSPRGGTWLSQREPPLLERRVLRPPVTRRRRGGGAGPARSAVLSPSTDLSVNEAPTPEPGPPKKDE